MSSVHDADSRERILRQTQLRQGQHMEHKIFKLGKGLDLRVCSTKCIQGSGPYTHRSLVMI